MKYYLYKHLLQEFGRWLLRDELARREKNIADARQDVRHLEQRIIRDIFATHALVTPTVEIYSEVMEWLDDSDNIECAMCIVALSPDRIEWIEDAVVHDLRICDYLLSKGWLVPRVKTYNIDLETNRNIA